MAYTFNAASTQYLSVPDTNSLDITGAISVAAWIKSTGDYGTAGKGIIAKWETAPNQRSYLLQVLSSGLPSFAVSASGLGTTGVTNAIRADGATAVGTAVRHVAGVFSPSTRIEIFLDGLSDGSNTTSVPASVFAGTAPLWLGVTSTLSTASVNTYFDGWIAEAAIYSTNLANDEVASLAKGVSPRLVRPESLVFYAPLIRDLIDVRGGLALTNNNAATVANHPRIYA